jgi:hypothetical protein
VIPVAKFFIPGVNGNREHIEDAYGKLRASIELELGYAPRADRIFKLWSRRGSIDCVTEVGREDPVRGGTVIAIFDMGPHRPFVVYRQQRPGTRDGTRDVLACSAYSVSEFDR